VELQNCSFSIGFYAQNFIKLFKIAPFTKQIYATQNVYHIDTLPWRYGKLLFASYGTKNIDNRWHIEPYFVLKKA
jgi:hypothetical protein